MSATFLKSPKSPRNMYFPPSAGFSTLTFIDTSSPRWNMAPKPTWNLTPPRKRKIPPPLDLGSIEEEEGSSEYDCGYLDLGAETPSASSPNLVENAAFVEQWAAAGIAVPRVPARRPSWRASSSGKDRGRSTGLKKDAVDRDCGICFEYAVVPCRTLCCGKIFCTGHLQDWLHGPNAEGRCPNCENACSLEGGTLSLAPPTFLPSSPEALALNKCNKPIQAKSKPGVYSSSPLTALQPHQNDTLQNSPPRSSPSGASPKKTTAFPQASPDGASSSSSSATVSSVSSDEEVNPGHPYAFPLKLDVVAPSASSANLSTTPFSASWGAISRLMSIVTFLMFLYKLLS
ncbi:hypothetical protein BDZ97DRAFT_1917903 [Flammula alnicola]|nr:hypothetical protein BDZ97DRAFT_1917903 [Flammula alnicola]